jgi:hypothetical protein
MVLIVAYRMPRVDGHAESPNQVYLRMLLSRRRTTLIPGTPGIDSVLVGESDTKKAHMTSSFRLRVETPI